MASVSTKRISFLPILLAIASPYPGEQLLAAHYYLRLFQNFSFGTATLDLMEKAGFRPLFRKPVPSQTMFAH
jgi:hypothetical protein